MWRSSLVVGLLSRRGLGLSEMVQPCRSMLAGRLGQSPCNPDSAFGTGWSCDLAGHRSEIGRQDCPRAERSPASPCHTAVMITEEYNQWTSTKQRLQGIAKFDICSSFHQRPRTPATSYSAPAAHHDAPSAIPRA